MKPVEHLRADNGRPNYRGMLLVYLDIAHVLHPSESLYQMCHGHDLAADGHFRYEYLPVLEHALEPWPLARIVLSDWTVASEGVEALKKQLGGLGPRVVGSLIEDLTHRVSRAVASASGYTRSIAYSIDDCRRMSRAQAVSAHVHWCKPSAWVALTSDYRDWSDEQRNSHVMVTDMLLALGAHDSQARLEQLLRTNFGSTGRDSPNSVEQE